MRAGTEAKVAGVLPDAAECCSVRQTAPTSRALFFSCPRVVLHQVPYYAELPFCTKLFGSSDRLCRAIATGLEN